MNVPNRLYFGDCLDVMREDIAGGSIDLIYLDPPFNSKRLYNAFIGNAQWLAFNDTWRWHEAVEDFHEVASDVRLAPTMEGLRLIHGEGPELAYLSYMTNRLRECHRVLKPTGSIYLHCDPTMSHSLKLVMDSIFGRGQFRNEIVWQRSLAHNMRTKGFQRVNDLLLYYSRGNRFRFRPVYMPYGEAQLKRYRRDSDGRLYTGQDLTFSTALEARQFEWRGSKPPPNRSWGASFEQLEKWFDEGRILLKRDGTPRLDGKKVYLDEMPGKPATTNWIDIPRISNTSQERLGYPTQKPLPLLVRILEASSGSGEVVLDPFCGCGTTIEAAQRLGRSWIGIDICVNACKVIEKRIRNHFDSVWSEVEFIGLPKTNDQAKTLASMDKFRFERWAAALVDGVEPNKRQRGDKGIDGWGRFPIRKGQFIDLVSQVKGGGTSPGDVQAFNGARQQAGADLGIFTCFNDRVTPRMRDAAASTGRFMEVPKVQIYTVEDYFEGRKPLLPLAS